MPPLMLPEIETLAEKDPLLYEILYRIQQAIINIPVLSGGVAPTPTPAVDSATGLPPTDSSGSPLSSVPTTSAPAGALPSAGINSNENGLYVQTDPTGLGSGIFAFGGSWQPLAKILRAADLAGKGVAAQKFLIPGRLLMQGIQFDIHGRPAGSFYSNAVDNTGSYLNGTHPLSQSGTSTTILIAANSWQFGEFQVSYNSGSVNPGSLGTYNVYFDDPLFNGGAPSYFAVAPGSGVVIAKRGRFFLGSITTSGGGGGTGSGGGNGGTCFSPETGVIVLRKGTILCLPIYLVRIGDQVLSRLGWQPVKRLLIHDYEGSLHQIPYGRVTPGHRIWAPQDDWVRAETIAPFYLPYKGKVYNLELDAKPFGNDDAHCFTLECGLVAHNVIKY